MGLMSKATMVIVGLIFVLIVGQIVESVFPELTRIFGENNIFATSSSIVFVLLALLSVGLIVRIILNLFEEEKGVPQFQGRPKPRQFRDGNEI